MPTRRLLQSVVAGNHTEGRIRSGIYLGRTNQAFIKRYNNFTKKKKKQQQLKVHLLLQVINWSVQQLRMSDIVRRKKS